MLRLVDLGDNELWRDAWGRPKVYSDLSLFSSLFVSSIDVDRWVELVDGVEQSTHSNTTSINGKLNITSSVLNQRVTLRSTRNPRYRPNRGHLYSTSILIPSSDLNAIHRFGLFNEESGVFFELNNGVWYGVLRSTLDGVTSDNKKEFKLNTYPKLQDAKMGNVFDIQYQWRGVGNYKLFINLDKIVSFEDLGFNTDLTIFNPAIPVSYEVEKVSSDNPVLQSGCVDVSTEGGDKVDLKFGSISVSTASGEVDVSGDNVPIIAIRSKKEITGVSGTISNTRDTKIFSINGYANQKSMLRLWKTRVNFDTAITEGTQTWTDYGDGRLEYIVIDPDELTPMTFDVSEAVSIISGRVPLDGNTILNQFDNNESSLFITSGDLYVVTMNRENGGSALVGASIQFGEEV